MKQSDPTSRGFTLVEIFVTVAIMGAIAAIMIPSVQRMKASAMSTQCVAKLRQIGIGLNNYFADHGRKYPVLVTARESKAEKVPTLDTVLAEYVPDEFVFQCPADHEGLFEETGSSYFWNSLINGQHLGNMDLLGLTGQESGIPVVSDKENFHRHVGDGVNVLYADGHVLRELQFVVDSR
jgi:prepilin-type N-terminal cleavage/methylation domain-containing protein/prepilin-type processing-associated H-X9-DG protein